MSLKGSLYQDQYVIDAQGLWGAEAREKVCEVRLLLPYKHKKTTIWPFLREMVKGQSIPASSPSIPRETQLLFFMENWDGKGHYVK